MAVHGICVVMMDTAQFWQVLQCAISFIEHFPATVNHEACVKKLQAAAAAAGLMVSFLQEPMRWSEDFGHYLQKTKGAFFGIGCGKEHTGLHTAGYEFDDEIIESAIAMYLQLVLQATAIASKVFPLLQHLLCAGFRYHYCSFEHGYSYQSLSSFEDLEQILHCAVHVRHRP